MVTRAEPAPAGADFAVVRSLRNRAILVLCDHQDVTPTLIAELRGDQVRHHEYGRLSLEVHHKWRCRWLIYLTHEQSAALVKYVEAARLWGEPVSLFGLSLEGVNKVLWRARRRR